MYPVFPELAGSETNDMNGLRGDMLSRRRNPQVVSVMGAMHRRANDDLVPLSDHVFDRIPQVGEASTQTNHDLFEVFAAWCPSMAEIVCGY